MALDAWTFVPEGSTTPDNYGDFDYSEAYNSGDMSMNQGSPSITRVFYIRGDRIPDFMDDLLGYSTGTGGTISRTLPDPHPYYSNFYAMEAKVNLLGQMYQATFMGKAFLEQNVVKVTAEYRSPMYEIKADEDIGDELERYVTRQYGFGGDAITINSTGMQFVSNIGADGRHLALNQPPARPTMTMELQYVWHMVPPNPDTSPYIPPNLGSIIDCYGKVNSTVFDDLHMDCPAGTVLFLGVDPKMTNYRFISTEDPHDNIFWEISFKFLYRENGFVSRGSINESAGHNFIWDQSKQWWDLITNDGTVTGGRLYETADLNTLFTLS